MECFCKYAYYKILMPIEIYNSSRCNVLANDYANTINNTWNKIFYHVIGGLLYKNFYINALKAKIYRHKRKTGCYYLWIYSRTYTNFC